jgi:hypothetical protein
MIIRSIEALFRLLDAVNYHSRICRPTFAWVENSIYSKASGLRTGPSPGLLHICRRHGKIVVQQSTLQSVIYVVQDISRFARNLHDYLSDPATVYLKQVHARIQPLAFQDWIEFLQPMVVTIGVAGIYFLIRRDKCILLV